MASTRSKLDEIVASFATLEDPRSNINGRHPLTSVLAIAVLAGDAARFGLSIRPTSATLRSPWSNRLSVGTPLDRRGDSLPGFGTATPTAIRAMSCSACLYDRG